MAKEAAKGAKGKNVSVSQESKVPARAFDQYFDQLLENFFSRRWPRRMAWPLEGWPDLEQMGAKLPEAKAPSVDVVDRESEVLVRAELPGIKKDDIELSVSNNTITIKGSTREETESDKDQYHRREIVSSFVSRTVPLGCEVDGDRAQARLNDGLLEVTIPKTQGAQRKRIEIRS